MNDDQMGLPQKIRSFLQKNNLTFQEDESMSNHTTYKVGGKAKFLVMAGDECSIRELFLFSRQRDIPFRVIGGGSNIIVNDQGLEGITLKFGDNFKSIERVRKDMLFCQSGCSTLELSEQVCSLGIAGFEFIYDIPGTVGGSILMNAGNRAGQMLDILDSVRFIKTSGEIIERKTSELDLGYRTSQFQSSKEIILGGYFKLTHQSAEVEIRRKMLDIKKERWEKFPMEYANAGSVFKRPKGDFAGRLIDVAKCSGLRRGGAQVSTKHRGFIVNLGNATSQDIMDLIQEVQRRVEEKTGVKLEMEQKYVQ